LKIRRGHGAADRLLEAFTARVRSYVAEKRLIPAGADFSG